VWTGAFPRVLSFDPNYNIFFHRFSLFAFTSRGKNPVSYATLSVRGSTMRAWLLPESLNLDALLVDDTPKKKAVVPKEAAASGRGRGRGRGRGLRR
jgi:small nuclear ribonucleoprotein D1